MLFYYLGCVALGVTTGLLVGLSSSPVVQYALPLLFALIGGSAGIFAIKTSVAAKGAQDRLKVAGLTALWLSAPFLLATLYGSLVRTGSDFASLVPAFRNPPEEVVFASSSLATLTPDDVISVLLANRGLVSAGVAKGDRVAVINKIIDRRVADETKFADVQSKISSSTSDLLKRFKKAVAENSDVANDSTFVSAWHEVTQLNQTFANAGVERRSKFAVANAADQKLSSEYSTSFSELLAKDPEFSDRLAECLALIRSLPEQNIMSATTRDDLLGVAKATNQQAEIPGVRPSVANRSEVPSPFDVIFDKTDGAT